MKRTRLSPLLSLLLLPLASLVMTPAGDVDARRAYPIRPITHQCKDVRRLVLDMAAQRAINEVYGYPHRYYGLDVATARGEKSGSEAGPGHVTGTNNQEQGVDEADIVKTNGRYIFSIKDRQIIVTRAWPTRSMKVVARVTLSEHATPTQLQLYRNKLVVLSSVWETAKQPVAKQPAADMPSAGMRIWQRPPATFSGTRITVYDISRAARPKLVSEVDVEGWMTRSRSIGDDIYLVTHGNLRVPDAVAKIAKLRAEMLPKVKNNDWKRMEAARKAGLPIVRRFLENRFRSLALNSAMPRTRRRIGNRMTRLAPMYSCSQLTVPANSPATNTQVLNVTHIDLDASAYAQNVGILGSGWQVYTSTNALYVASPNYSASGQNPGTSQIHKFTLRTQYDDRPRYQGTGTVPGHLLNQFAMSEHNGFLRVMTTDAQWGRQGRIDTAANNLFVLRPLGRRLQIVGSVRGLAEGERVFSARMFGDKGYMVTFRQTDPLFTFDLSNPYKPRMVGELKVNGFSSYIHPLDGDRLLTIGRDADKNGRVKGLHLQVFDVSNPAKPVRVHHRLLTGGRWAHSAAQHNHHAFTYDAKTRTLAIPVSSYDYRSRTNHSGLEVFDISRRGIRYRGAVTHNKLSTSKSDWRGQWERNITRSMIIGNALVSLSQAGLVASHVRRPSWTLSKVSFDAPVKPFLKRADPRISLNFFR